MKKIVKLINAAIVITTLAFLLEFAVAHATIQGSQGGTGISTTTAGNVNNCLVVSSSSPFLLYTLGTCGGGGGGGSSTIVHGTNGVIVTGLSGGSQTSSLDTSFAAIWSALQTFNLGATFNSTSTHNSSTIFTFQTSTLLSTDANGKVQTTTLSGLTFSGNTLTANAPSTTIPTTFVTSLNGTGGVYSLYATSPLSVATGTASTTISCPTCALTATTWVSTSSNGVTNDLPIWTGNSALGNSSLSQAGGLTFVGSAAVFDPVGDVIAPNIFENTTSTDVMGYLVGGGDVGTVTSSVTLSDHQFCAQSTFDVVNTTGNITFTIPSTTAIQGYSCGTKIFAGQYTLEYIKNNSTNTVTAATTGSSETQLFAPGTPTTLQPGQQWYSIGNWVNTSPINGATGTGQQFEIDYFLLQTSTPLQVNGNTITLNGTVSTTIANAFLSTNSSGQLTAFTSSTTSGGSNCLLSVTMSATGTLSNTNTTCSGGGGGGGITTSSLGVYTEGNLAFFETSSTESASSGLSFASSTGVLTDGGLTFDGGNKKIYSANSTDLTISSGNNVNDHNLNFKGNSINVNYNPGGTGLGIRNENNSNYGYFINNGLMPGNETYNLPWESGRLALGTSTTVGDCAKWLTTSTLADAGSPCGSGSGGVTTSSAGIAQALPLWTSASALGNSLVYQNSGNTSVFVSSTPNATATLALLTIGPTAISNGNASGTWFGNIAPTSSNADLINFENYVTSTANGVTVFKVASSGAVTIGSPLSSYLATNASGLIIATTSFPAPSTTIPTAFVSSVNGVTGAVNAVNTLNGSTGTYNLYATSPLSIATGTASTTISCPTCGTGNGTVTTGTANTAPQIAVGLGGSAIGFYSGATFTSSTGVLAAPTGTFSGTLAVGTTTQNGIISAVNASNTTAFKVSTLTGATSSAVSFNVLGNTSSSATSPINIFQILSSGHINATGTKPTVSSCGTGSPSVIGSDVTGIITIGGGAVGSCKLTFQVPYESSNIIPIVDDSSSTDAVEVTAVSSSSFTATFAQSLTGGTIYYWIVEAF